MLIPSDTAKPLNCFLNSGVTLKLSDTFSLSEAPLSLVLSVRVLAKVASLALTVARCSAKIQISVFLSIRKDRNRPIQKTGN